MFTFPDGAVFETATPGFTIARGGRYVFFLGSVTSEPVAARGAFRPLSGAAGVVDIRSERTGVVPMARPSDPIAMQYTGRDIGSFLQAVRSEVATPSPP